jgi:hypothetical protein
MAVMHDLTVDVFHRVCELARGLLEKVRGKMLTASDIKYAVILLFASDTTPNHFAGIFKTNQVKKLTWYMERYGRHYLACCGQLILLRSALLCSLPMEPAELLAHLKRVNTMAQSVYQSADAADGAPIEVRVPFRVKNRYSVSDRSGCFFSVARVRRRLHEAGFRRVTVGAAISLAFLLESMLNELASLIVQLPDVHAATRIKPRMISQVIFEDLEFALLFRDVHIRQGPNLKLQGVHPALLPTKKQDRGRLGSKTPSEVARADARFLERFSDADKGRTAEQKRRAAEREAAAAAAEAPRAPPAPLADS